MAGEKIKIEKILDGQKPFEIYELGSSVKVMLDAPYNDEWKEIASLHGLSIEKAILQDYLLNK